MPNPSDSSTTVQRKNNWLRRSRRQRAPPKEVYDPDAGTGEQAEQPSPRKRRAIKRKKEEDQLYLDIHTWNKDKWNDFLLDSSKLPTQIVKRFGMPCLVRQQNLDEHKIYSCIPALEVSPLDVRGVKKHDLRRDFLLALNRYLKEGGDEPHLVYLCGVRLGDFHLEEEHTTRRSRQPFALVLGSDYVADDDLLASGFMNFSSRYKSINEKLHEMEEMDRRGEFDLSKSLLLSEEEIIEAYCQFDDCLAKTTAADRVAFIAEHYHSDDAGCEIDYGDEDGSSSYLSSSSSSLEMDEDDEDGDCIEETPIELLPKSTAAPENDAIQAKQKKEMIPGVVISSEEALMELSSIEESRKSAGGNAKRNSVAEISFRSGSLAVSRTFKEPKTHLDYISELERQYDTSCLKKATVVVRMENLFNIVFNEDLPNKKVTENLEYLKQNMNDHIEMFKTLCDEWGVDNELILDKKLRSLAEIIGVELNGDSFDEMFENLRISI
mmetsp:Transcript_32986/g.47777  ORF Transcript_32986/g.47777 Transcript_32986/m.47777 type:complete len:493 (+) Transcript_32986:65-1543(+)